MKFTQTETTNQRIDRITMKHAVVGIDIAKDVHAAQVTDFRGRVLTSRHLSFTNTLEGFERLVNWIQNVQAKKGLTSLIIGLEPTGHYWFNLANWLLERQIDVVLVNPVTTHRNKENRDNSPSKNDPKDALVIADVVSRGYYTEYEPHTEAFERLKVVVSNREYWTKQQISVGNRIVRWIDLYFPEFRQVFKEWTGKRSIASLHLFPLPSDLHHMKADELIAGWRKQGMQRAGGASGRQTAIQLLTAAKHSIGNAQAAQEARRDLQRLLEDYDKTTEYLEEMQQEIIALLGGIPMAQQLLSIPGMGVMTVAAVLGLGGDLGNYSHGQQLLRRAGLNLAECTSGKFKGQIKLSKRGDSVLRKQLYLGILGIVQRNEDFKRWHEENLQRGMTKMDSLFKLIGKLTRIMVGMVHRGETYHSTCPDTGLLAA